MSGPLKRMRFSDLRKGDRPRRFVRTSGLMIAISLFAWVAPAASQVVPEPAPNRLVAPTAPVAPGEVPPVEIDNPLGVLEDAAEQLPGFEGGLSSTINVMLLLTVLSLAPAIVILCTSFVRIIVVLALVRQAIGTQTLPPSQVITGLAIFLTMLIMAPTFERINSEALQPLSRGEITQIEAWTIAKQPLREFMFAQIQETGNWGDVYMVLNYRGVDTSDPDALTYGDVDMLTLIPAYILSELKTAFLIGFRIYLPFLVIDMVISSLLISMGMLMLPPVLISLPFKLLLFVLVDGWRLIVGNLLDGFVTGVPPGY